MFQNSISKYYYLEYDDLLQFYQEMRCTICLDIYNQPYVTVNCGHVFCLNCIENYLKSQNYKANCPLCKANLTKRDLVEDKKTQAIIEIFKKIKKLELNQNALCQQTKTIDLKQEQSNKDFLCSNYSQKLRSSQKKLLSSSSSSSLQMHSKKKLADLQNNNNNNNNNNSLALNLFDSSMRQLRNSQQNKVKLGLTDKVNESNSSQVSNKVNQVFQNSNIYNCIFSQINIQLPQTPEKYDKSQSMEEIHLLVSNLPEQFNDEITKFCKLYKAKLHQTFNNSITHLIVYPEVESHGLVQAKRTIKYLQAIINGIWVLSYTWIVHCNGYQTIVKEDEYEVNADCRGQLSTGSQSRLNGGMKQLFDGYRFYVDDTQQNKATISKKDLEALIQQAGGNAISTPKFNEEQEQHFYLIIAQDQLIFAQQAKSLKKKNNYYIVFHKWILDSISSGRILKTSEYM